MKKSLKKLQLSRETLRALESERLGGVTGGIVSPSCPPTYSCDNESCVFTCTRRC